MLAFSIIHSEMVPVLVAFLTGIVGPIVLLYFKHALSAKKEKDRTKRRDDFNITINVQQKINSTLNLLQSKYDLDRVWIAQFHNGGNFYPGNKSMKKMSATFESTKPGVSTDLMKLQNLPISFFSNVLTEMNESHSGVIVETDGVHENAFKDFWLHRGVHRSYMFPIICLEGDFIAILGIDFNNLNGRLSDELYKELENEAKLLAGYVAIVSIEKHN
jgi:hypothetical protein